MSAPQIQVSFAQYYPRLSSLLRKGQIEQRSEEFERLGVAPLFQVERDLALLARYVAERGLTRAYRNLLSNTGRFVEALYEIHVAAMLAPVATDLVFAPQTGKKRCDLACTIGGSRISIEITSYIDRWPPPDGRLYGRATVEKSFDPTTRGPDPDFRETPASKELRDRILGKIHQLPRGQMNLIVLGAPNTWSQDVGAALYGDPYFLFSTASSSVERTPNGLFCVPADVGGASGVSALVWLKLRPSFLDMQVSGRLFVNANAARALPEAAVSVLRQVFDRGAVLRKELERITSILVERYCPERIILFGSLADEISSGQDRVHQWSDIDLAIVKETPLRFFDRIGQVLKLVEPRVAVNILIYTPEEFNRAERAGSFFVKDEILKRGHGLFP